MELCTNVNHIKEILKAIQFFKIESAFSLRYHKSAWTEGKLRLSGNYDFQSTWEIITILQNGFNLLLQNEIVCWTDGIKDK